MHAEGLDTGRIFHGRKLTPTAQPAGITYLSKSDYLLPCGLNSQTPFLLTTSPAMPALPLGERLRQLRTTLAAEAFDPQAWPRARVAREAGVSGAALARLEDTGNSTAANLSALLRFYQDQGFNLAWVLAPDNEGIPLHAFRDIFEDEAHLRPLLKQVQRGIHQALVHLLPPIRLVLSAADLSEYQRRLPPVRAAAAGWRSAAVHVVPYHYYEAGEFLPRCGSPAYYLTYDPGLELVSDVSKCPYCRTQLNKDQETPGLASAEVRNQGLF
ncbi:MAG: hypothetical protein EOO62_05340 [Hymenobacter sp.]|nr:MAG: hypothetical protein EOO62_05340 [Hymenobacter sp.]